MWLVSSLLENGRAEALRSLQAMVSLDLHPLAPTGPMAAQIFLARLVVPRRSRSDAPNRIERQAMRSRGGCRLLEVTPAHR
jgi:hypothetical protein